MNTAEKLSREDLARMVAHDIPVGAYVNLGIGQPTKVSDYLAPDQGVTLHTENGMLGMGPQAHGEDIDGDLINAGKIPVTELPGTSYFHHADSFAMMRGGHLDVCVLGAFQVSSGGDLANWSTGAPDAIPAVGGAMDLAIGAKSVFVMMSLFAKDGSPKIVPELSYPATGLACVTRIYTDHGVFLVEPPAASGEQEQPSRIVLREPYGLSLMEIQDRLDVDVVDGSR
jgi:3-oxoadipate CoA-transferase beta subunit